jgi:1-acyl-sn-glycerol-3-phosphate acyltransferase
MAVATDSAVQLKGVREVNNEEGTSSGADNCEDDERRVLRDVRSLLDQLQLDVAHDLSMESDLSKDFGVDSLALVELCDLLERSFVVTLPDEVFLTARTPREWLASIRKAKGTDGPSVSSSDELRDGPVGVRIGATTTGLFRRLTQAAQRHRPPRRLGPDRAKKHGPGRSGSHVEEWLHFIYSWLLLVPFALTVWTLAVLPISLKTRRRVGRFFARGLCRALGISLFLEGSLPSSLGSFIVAANHASFIDGLVLYVMVPEPLVFVSSVEIERQPFLGRIANGYGCLFVERGRAERSAASVEKLVGAVNEGKRLAIFPEGSISRGSGVRVFHLGAFETATSANCPVVPIGIRGTRGILRSGSYRPNPGTVRVVIGSPIAPAGIDFSARVALRDEVRAAIAALCGESSIGSA